MPHDVIDGKPLRYRPTDGGGYILYSIGLNGHDDSGVESESVKPQEQLDWVWRVPSR